MGVWPTGPANGRTGWCRTATTSASTTGRRRCRRPAAGCRVVAPDRIGLGKSSEPGIRCTVAMLAEHAVRLPGHLHIGHAAVVAVVANSMGGMLGLASQEVVAAPPATPEASVLRPLRDSKRPAGVVLSDGMTSAIGR